MIATVVVTEVMTVFYTEETLKSLTKTQIIDLFLKIQKHSNSTISRLADEIRNLNANFKRLELDAQVFKKSKLGPSEACSFP